MLISDRAEEQEVGSETMVDYADAEQVDAGSQIVISPMELAWLLWNARKVIFRNCVYALVVSALIAFIIPKRYTATTRLMPPNSNSAGFMSLLPALVGQDTPASNGSVMGLASRLLGGNSSTDLFIGVLRSESVEDRLISKFGLQELYSKRYIEDTRDKLESVTDIKADKKTGILSVSVEDKDPQRAAAMAQAYVEELNRTLAHVNTSSAHRERMFIASRLDEVKEDLDRSAKEFSVFASQNSAIDIPGQAKAMVEAAANLQGQLIAAQSELRAVQQIYTDNNIRVKGAQARIRELQSQIDKFGGKGVDPAKDSVLAKGEMYPSIRQLPLLGVKYLDLYRQNKIDEAVFELLTKQYELAKIQEAREIPSAQILDPAVVPTKKSWPKRSMIILGGLLLAIVCTGSWIVAGTLWERIDPEDPRRVFAEAVFAAFRTNVWDSELVQRLRRYIRSIAKILRIPKFARNRTEVSGS